MFTGPGLVMPREHVCEVETVSVDASALSSGELLVENEYSVVSAGTEVAVFTGLAPGVRVLGSWCAYPFRPGYGAVGRVVAVGRPPVRQLGPIPDERDRVFAITCHARFAVADLKYPVIRIREDDDAKTLVLARMASIAITAVRKSERVQLGARAIVIGLGLVGNFAAQLLQLAGMRVLGLDRARHRVEMATESGLTALEVNEPVDREQVWAMCGGEGGDVVVEASGVPDAAHLAARLAKDGGDVVLLGSPRGEFHEDTTEMLRQVHLRGLRIVGALESVLPVRTGKWEARWSIDNDYKELFQLLREGRLKTHELVSHVVLPDQAQAIYSRLASDGTSMGAVLFDWRAE